MMRAASRQVQAGLPGRIDPVGSKYVFTGKFGSPQRGRLAAMQMFKTRGSGSLGIKLWGGGATCNGGDGAALKGSIAKPTSLVVYVGGGGAVTYGHQALGEANGGRNGGGLADYGGGNVNARSSGGAATGIRTCAGTRIAVAGGGGGGSWGAGSYSPYCQAQGGHAGALASGVGQGGQGAASGWSGAGQDGTASGGGRGGTNYYGTAGGTGGTAGADGQFPTPANYSGLAYGGAGGGGGADGSGGGAGGDSFNQSSSAITNGDRAQPGKGRLNGGHGGSGTSNGAGGGGGYGGGGAGGCAYSAAGAGSCLVPSGMAVMRASQDSDADRAGAGIGQSHYSNAGGDGRAVIVY